MTEHLGEWLRFELEKRGWSINDLVRRSESSQATILRVIDGYQKADAEFCKSIAPALNLSEEHVLRMADLLSQLPEPEVSYPFLKIYKLMKTLSPEERVEIMKYVRWRSNKGAQ